MRLSAHDHTQAHPRSAGGRRSPTTRGSDSPTPPKGVSSSARMLPVPSELLLLVVLFQLRNVEPFLVPVSVPGHTHDQRNPSSRTEGCRNRKVLGTQQFHQMPPDRIGDRFHKRTLIAVREQVQLEGRAHHALLPWTVSNRDCREVWLTGLRTEAGDLREHQLHTVGLPLASKGVRERLQQLEVRTSIEVVGTSRSEPP